jgi:hypothetical protein
MTEAEWLACDDWRPMMAHLAGGVSKRKGTLYVCAGLRWIWDLLYDDASRKAVETAEQAADGAVTEEDIGYATWSAEVPTFGCDFDSKFIREYMGEGNYSPGVKRLLEMGVYAEADIRGEERLGDKETVLRLSNAAHIAYHCLYQIKDGRVGDHLLEHMSAQSEWPGGWLVREVFGNPFQSVSVLPEWLSWREGIVPTIARWIYEDRAFDRLPILADALEGAGCPEADMLAHCRQVADHVRGCWVIDSVLGLG